MSVFVIAEGGSCHDGDPVKAHNLVLAAKRAGADAVKFQFWSSADRLAARRNVPDAYRAIYARYQISRQWLDNLSESCQQAEIEFMATTYLPEDIPTVAPYVKRFKIASFEAGDGHFIRCHYEWEQPVIVSLGMGAVVPRALRSGRDAVLHCVSAYPTPIDQANLRRMLGLRWNTHGPFSIGFSDHTHNVLTGAVATAAGAEILEVHLRLYETNSENPDYVTALTPDELAQYIAYVRQAELLLGDGEMGLQVAEEPMIPYRVVR